VLDAIPVKAQRRAAGAAAYLKIYCEFASEISHQRLNFVEQICPVHRNEVAPVILRLLPQDFDAVQLRAVGRQILQVQPLLCPPAPLFVHGVAFGDPGIVEHDNARYRMWSWRNAPSTLTR